jgi:hypothetical protein
VVWRDFDGVPCAVVIPEALPDSGKLSANRIGILPTTDRPEAQISGRSCEISGSVQFGQGHWVEVNKEWLLDAKHVPGSGLGRELVRALAKG